MKQVNRRQFMGSVTAGTVLGPAIFTGSGSAANKKIRTGVIGCGWYGGVDVDSAFNVGGFEFVGICDVDTAQSKKMADTIEKKQGSRPKIFNNYKKLLEMDELDALFVTTPPHWHPLIVIDALDRGLDMYCEKPVSYDVREGEAMIAAEKKHPGRIIQVGFQRRQSPAINETKKFVQDGGVGDLIQIEAQINFRVRTKDATPMDPPETLDWNQWCGPGPLIPYSLQVGHFLWRYEKISGNGHLVDWGIHLIDAVRQIIQEKMPKTIQSTGGIYATKDHYTTPDILTTHYEFETCPVTWRHRMYGAAEYNNETNNGIFIYGTKGTVFVSEHRWTFIHHGKNAKRVEHSSPEGMNVSKHMALSQMQEFADSFRSRKPAPCSLTDAHYSTATVNMGMIAYELGQKLTWDDASGKFVNNPAANMMLKRKYRAPYKHPFKG